MAGYKWGLVGVRTRVITSASPRADYINYMNVLRDLPVPVSRFSLISLSHSPVYKSVQSGNHEIVIIYGLPNINIDDFQKAS